MAEYCNFLHSFEHCPHDARSHQTGLSLAETSSDIEILSMVPARYFRQPETRGNNGGTLKLVILRPFGTETDLPISFAYKLQAFMLKVFMRRSPMDRAKCLVCEVGIQKNKSDAEQFLNDE